MSDLDRFNELVDDIWEMVFGTKRRPETNLVEKSAEVWDAILAHLEASWASFGFVFGLIFVSFFCPKPEKHIFWKPCSHAGGSITFQGPRGQKSSRKRSKT